MREDHWSWLISEYKKTQTALAFTEEMGQKLKQESDRAGIGAQVLIKNAQNVPLGLTIPMVTTYLGTQNNHPSRIREDHYKWLVETFENLASEKKIINITIEMRDELIREMNRTRQGQDLIAASLPSKPETLSGAKIRNWAKDAKTAYADDWDCVISFLKSLPTLIKVTSEMRGFLKAEYNRIGKGPAEIIANSGLRPDGFDVRKVYSITGHKRAVVKESDWNWYIDKLKKYDI